jgi:hypothetical protein
MVLLEELLGVLPPLPQAFVAVCDAPTPNGIKLPSLPNGTSLEHPTAREGAREGFEIAG